MEDTKLGIDFLSDSGLYDVDFSARGVASRGCDLV